MFLTTPSPVSVQNSNCLVFSCRNFWAVLINHYQTLFSSKIISALTNAYREMLRSSFRHSNLKSLFSILTCTIAQDRWCFSCCWETHTEFSPWQTDMIKISQTSTCFYFTALEHTALGNNPKLQLFYIVLQFSEQAVGQVTERRAAPLSAFPVPHRAQPWGQLWNSSGLGTTVKCKSGLRGRLCCPQLIPPPLS